VTGHGPLEDELRRLRRGEGIYAADLDLRVGPTLRRLTAAAEGDDSAVLRRKLADWLDQATEQLDADSRLAVGAALAVPLATRGRFFGDRLAWLAAEWKCDQRTARRRVDRAFRLLTTTAERDSTQDGAGRPAAALNGVAQWAVASFVAVLRMDVETIEAIELRRIVAAVDGLSELVTSISLPWHPDDRSESHGLCAELLFGGRLERREQPYKSYFQHVIALASPLAAGAEHEYGIRLTMPPGQPLAPHYVHMPFTQTSHFVLHARFPPDRVPQRVWRLVGVPPVVIYEREPNGEVLRPDRFGEVRCEFRDLVQGCVYGIRWEPAGKSA
jgi:hypothetical protein